MMETVELKINLSDDCKESIRAEVQSGRYVYEDDVIVHAIYLHAQELDRKGIASLETKVVLARSLEQTLSEFRQALSKKLGHS